MEKSKKIAFLISSLDCGGAQRAVANLSLAIPDDWEIDIILNNSSNVVYPYKGNLVPLGIKIPAKRDSLIYQTGMLIKRIIALKKIKKQNDYLAVISFLHSANIANIFSGNRHCKVILSVRTNISKLQGNKIKKYLTSHTVHKYYNRAVRIISLSKGVEFDLVNNHGIDPNKLTTIYNCYDFNNILSLSHKPSAVTVDSDKINYVTMGRLTTQKGQWHLIRAFSEVVKANKNARLYILGTGEMEEYLEEIITAFNLTDSVYLCGFVDNPYAALAKMDVFVFPSLWEGFGNALLEAMTIGLPCIATDYESGAREILQNSPSEENSCTDVEYADYGILIPVPDGRKYSSEPLTGEEHTMADAMIRLGNNPQLREQYSLLSVKRSGMFDMETIWNEWEQILS